MIYKVGDKLQIKSDYGHPSFKIGFEIEHGPAPYTVQAVKEVPPGEQEGAGECWVYVGGRGSVRNPMISELWFEPYKV